MDRLPSVQFPLRLQLGKGPLVGLQPLRCDPSSPSLLLFSYSPLQFAFLVLLLFAARFQKRPSHPFSNRSLPSSRHFHHLGNIVASCLVLSFSTARILSIPTCQPAARAVRVLLVLPAEPCLESLHLAAPHPLTFPVASYLEPRAELPEKPGHHRHLSNSAWCEKASRHPCAQTAQVCSHELPQAQVRSRDVQLEQVRFRGISKAIHHELAQPKRLRDVS
mmetsp:Transcript_41089/g.108769  ORF Transcript_41089/g.108769 Transcript_41089/m.108769 type:complete len:220 (-) Transcript_41089:137-796(-)